MDYKKLSKLLYSNVNSTVDYYEKIYQERNLPQGSMVTRFAPSPTGNAHMGNIYSAFIDYVFARQTNGIFMLRIEDTDQKRQIENGIQGIIDDLKNFDISFDEDPVTGGAYGPYIQTQRQKIYDTFAKHLISIGAAYPCFCSEEEISKIKEAQERKKDRIGYYGKYAICRNLTYEEIEEKIKNNIPYTLRLKSTGTFENKTILEDLVKGHIEFPQNDMDYILIKSDKVPLYHFAHVVDDHLMKTTHVIRDESWLSSYPLHHELFLAFNFKLPAFAHIAPLNKKDGESIRKLSKRKDPEAGIRFYHESGIPSDVIKLYLSTITNSNFEEWYNNNLNLSLNDFNFTFNKMSKSGPLFDLEKLNSISRIYFSRLKAKDLYEDALKYFHTYDEEFYNLIKKYKDYTINILNIEREIERPRKDIYSYKSIKSEISYMYDELFNGYTSSIKDFYTFDILEDYINNVYNENDDKQTWFEKIKNLCPKYGFTTDNKEYKNNPEQYKGTVASVCEIIRVALTDKTMTPDLYEILKLLGKERISKRFDKFKEYINK